MLDGEVDGPALLEMSGKGQKVANYFAAGTARLK
jgi:hypothetical protein